jgi:hypothetical protein
MSPAYWSEISRQNGKVSVSTAVVSTKTLPLLKAMRRFKIGKALSRTVQLFGCIDNITCSGVRDGFDRLLQGVGTLPFDPAPLIGNLH